MSMAVLSSPRDLLRRSGSSLFDAAVRLVEIAKGDTRNLEGGFGLLTLWWSGWLLLCGPGSFNVPSWDVLRAFTPPAYVGPIGVCIALCRFSGLGFDVWRLRAFASLCGFAFWLSITLCCYLYDPASTGARVYGFYAMLNAFLLLRIVARRHGGRA